MREGSAKHFLNPVFSLNYVNYLQIIFYIVTRFISASPYYTHTHFLFVYLKDFASSIFFYIHIAMLTHILMNIIYSSCCCCKCLVQRPLPMLLSVLKLIAENFNLNSRISTYPLWKIWSKVQHLNVYENIAGYISCVRLVVY